MLTRSPYTSFFGDIERLQREMNQLFDSFPGSWERITSTTPTLRMWVNDENVIITAEVPGVKADDLDIQVVGDTLKLSGERKFEKVSDEITTHRREQTYGKFSRAIQLPYPINTNQIEAEFEKGILKIKLPREESSKPRKISVKVGSQSN